MLSYRMCMMPMACVICHLLSHVQLCGVHPFFRSGFFARDEDSNATRKQVEFPDDIDADARDLITRLLVKDVTKRMGCGAKGTSCECKQQWGSPCRVMAGHVGSCRVRSCPLIPAYCVMFMCHVSCLMLMFYAAPASVQSHPFFSSIDFASLLSDGAQHRFSSMLKYAASEQPQFRDVAHVIATVKAADPALQLEKLGLYEL